MTHWTDGLVLLLLVLCAAGMMCIWGFVQGFVKGWIRGWRRALARRRAGGGEEQGR